MGQPTRIRKRADADRALSKSATSATEEYSPFDHRRDEILASAARVFRVHGYAAGTTKEIAAEVGLSQPAIYHYVGSKEDLLREIVLKVARDIMDTLAAGSGGVTAARRLRAVIDAFVQAIVEDRDAFEVYWKEAANLPEAVHVQVSADERLFMSRLGELVAEVQREGFLPKDAPKAVVTEAITGMVCWTFRWYRPGGPVDVRVIADVFCDILGLPK